jgi:hypothetical protein
LYKNTLTEVGIHGCAALLKQPKYKVSDFFYFFRKDNESFFACSGIEPSLEACPHSNNNNTCGPNDAAGVRCSTDLHDMGELG